MIAVLVSLVLITGSLLILLYFRRTVDASHQRHPDEQTGSAIECVVTATFGGGRFGSRIPNVRLAVDPENLYISSYNPVAYSVRQNRYLKIPRSRIESVRELAKWPIVDNAIEIRFRERPEHLESKSVVVFGCSQEVIDEVCRNI